MILCMLASCCAWNYATLEVHVVVTLLYKNFQIYRILTRSNYTSNMATKYDSDVSDVTAPHI